MTRTRDRHRSAYRLAGIAVAWALAGGSGCASVPKEAVTLSSLVGRDLGEVHRAHRQVTTVLFDRMRQDVDRFVNEVYAPSQTQAAVQEQVRRAQSDDVSERQRSLFAAAAAASQPDAPQELVDAVTQGFTDFNVHVRASVESMRSELIGKIDAQEREVLEAIDRAYHQIRTANSLVTAHLSSIHEVHESQAEVLEAAGLPPDLRGRVGDKLSKVSAGVADIVGKAEKAEMKVEEARSQIAKAIDELKP